MKVLATENEIEVSVEGARILGVNQLVLADGKLKIQVITKNEQAREDNIFALVEASKLSLDDEFMSYEPTTKEEKEFKKRLTVAIEKGLSDFYRPVIDPSFNEDGSICYAKGRRPAIGKSYYWWWKTAIEFEPERSSRLGTRTEYIAFLGVLIKSLIASGWNVSRAWNAVCNDSKELGHFRNLKNAKDDFEPTGSREICGFYDLANTYKILAGDNGISGIFDSDIWLASGSRLGNSYQHMLADLSCNDYNKYCDVVHNLGVGWIVLEN